MHYPDEGGRSNVRHAPHPLHAAAVLLFLRKTSDPTIAEDLAADVLLSALTTLREGRAITHLHAWVWQVARHRYAAWAAQKRHRRENEAAPDEVDSIPSPGDPLDDTLRQEDMSLLRRELAFIRREHRELIVAFYIEDRRIQDIAHHLHLPDGTVKARLHRVRKKLKEGMQMAREFGPRSYNPENMDFVTSGNMPSGLPGCAMRRSLPRNILLEAGDNPSTVEELAMALGVAVPYMEEEVRLLADATLLKKQGDRYVTDFYIMDGETQKHLRKTLRVDSEGRTKAVRRIARDMLPVVREIHPDNARFTDNALLWWLLPHVHEIALFADPHYISEFPARNCGEHETWGVTGFEKVEDPDWELCWLSRSLNVHDGNAAGIYKYDHADGRMWDRTGQLCDMQQIMLLGSILRGNRPLSSLTDTEKSTWRHIDGRFAHAEGDHIVADIVVLPRTGMDTLEAAVHQHPCYPALEAAVSADFTRLLTVLRAIPSAVLQEQLHYVASNEICNSRMMVINDCLADGTLRLPAKPETSTVGMWIELR